MIVSKRFLFNYVCFVGHPVRLQQSPCSLSGFVDGTSNILVLHSQPSLVTVSQVGTPYYLSPEIIKDVGPPFATQMRPGGQMVWSRKTDGDCAKQGNDPRILRVGG